MKIEFGKQEFECKRDNLTIRGYLLRPQLKGKLPAVIISHGFGDNSHGTQKYAEWFAENGYIAVYYDFNGGSKINRSDGKTENMTVLTEKADLLAVLNTVRNLNYVDQDQVILSGCSQGGFVSALTAAERVKDIAALILYFPALCIPDDARKGSMLDSKFDPKNIPETFSAAGIKLGREYAATAQKLGPWKEICVYSRPVLISHGTNDQAVPIAYSERAAKEYPCAELQQIKGAGHGYDEKAFHSAMRGTFEFLNGIFH